MTNRLFLVTSNHTKLVGNNYNVMAMNGLYVEASEATAIGKHVKWATGEVSDRSLLGAPSVFDATDVARKFVKDNPE